MSNVKRYTFYTNVGDIIEEDDGDYVDYDDYKSLEVDVEKMKFAFEFAVREIWERSGGKGEFNEFLADYYFDMPKRWRERNKNE